MLDLQPPLDADRLRIAVGDVNMVHVSEPFADDEYRTIAQILESHPDVILRVNTDDEDLCTLSFLHFFPNLRRFSMPFLYNARSTEALNALSDDLELLDLGLTQKALDLRPLKFRNLRVLSVDHHERGLAELIAGNSELRNLTLKGMKAEKILGSVESSNLETLLLVGGSLNDASWLRQMPGLKELNLAGTRGIDDAMLKSILESSQLEWLTLDTLSGITHMPDLIGQKHLKRLDLNSLSNMRDTNALQGLRNAPVLDEVSITSSKLPPSALQPLANHPTLTALTAGLGSAKKNQQAEAITGLPRARSQTEYARPRTN